MPSFFKKRRRGPAGPNKNEQKVMRARSAENRARAGGLMGQNFPAVKKLTIRLEFTTPQQHLMDSKTLTLGPSDPCDFTAACPGRCGSGSFDFSAKVRSVVEGRQSSGESAGVCREPLYPGAADICGLRLQCRIEASYAPEPAPSEARPAS
jgi:hypothetical protein